MFSFFIILLSFLELKRFTFVCNRSIRNSISQRIVRFIAKKSSILFDKETNDGLKSILNASKTTTNIDKRDDKDESLENQMPPIETFMELAPKFRKENLVKVMLLRFSLTSVSS